jgi:hypothetical protein
MPLFGEEVLHWKPVYRVPGIAWLVYFVYCGAMARNASSF